MFIVVPIIIFFLMMFLRAFNNEMERQDQLRLNASLSSNFSLLLADDFNDAWLTVRVLDNITAGENKTNIPSAVEPDWEMILGSFEHYKDENFEEFLIAAGAPYFVRNMILSATPTVTIERIYEDDYYYYDLEYDYPDPDYDHHTGEKDQPVYQMVITSSTWLSSHSERFRMGYTFVKTDFDGTDSKNTYRFAAPTVMVHSKVKEQLSTNIIRKFDKEGIVVTIVNKATGMAAKRYYRRLQV